MIWPTMDNLKPPSDKLCLHWWYFEWAQVCVVTCKSHSQSELCDQMGAQEYNCLCIFVICSAAEKNAATQSHHSKVQWEFLVMRSNWIEQLAIGGYSWASPLCDNGELIVSNSSYTFVNADSSYCICGNNPFAQRTIICMIACSQPLLALMKLRH